MTVIISSMYSPSENTIYPASLYYDFVAAGTWPKDGINVTDEDAVKYNGGNKPQGKMLCMIKGKLAWIDEPSPTQNQLIAQAEEIRMSHIFDAKATISIWQTELQLGIISDTDKELLITWLTYIKKLNLIDTSSAPDIEWPTLP